MDIGHITPLENLFGIGREFGHCHNTTGAVNYAILAIVALE